MADALQAVKKVMEPKHRERITTVEHVLSGTVLGHPLFSGLFPKSRNLIPLTTLILTSQQDVFFCPDLYQKVTRYQLLLHTVTNDATHEVILC